MLSSRPQETIDTLTVKHSWHDVQRYIYEAKPFKLESLGSCLILSVLARRWWLERQSEPLGKNNNQVPPALAALVFEVQEELLDIDEGPGKVRDSLEERLENLESRRESDRTRIEEILQEWPADGDEKSGALADLKNILSELSYLATLVRDIRRALKEA